MHRIPIVHARDISKQITQEKKIYKNIENVIKQLVHMSAVCSSRYEAFGKFGEHERCIRVAQGIADSNSSFLSVLHISMNTHSHMNHCSMKHNLLME